MPKAALIIRILLGLMLLAFGSNKFLGFMPPPDLTEPAQAFMGALVETGYMMPTIAIVEIISGLLLVSGFLVPLGLVLLAPISVNIMLFHLILDPANIAPAAIVAILNLFLLFAYKPAYERILCPKYNPFDAEGK